MNISRAEQRTLHALAQGGCILLERDDQGRIIAARCFTREGWVLDSCDLEQWRSLTQGRHQVAKRRPLCRQSRWAGSPAQPTGQPRLRTRFLTSKDARDTEVACVRQGFSAAAMKAVTLGQAS